MEIEWYNMDRQTHIIRQKVILIVVFPFPSFFTPQNYINKCGGAMYNPMPYHRTLMDMQEERQRKINPQIHKLNSFIFHSII